MKGSKAQRRTSRNPPSRPGSARIPTASEAASSQLSGSQSSHRLHHTNPPTSPRPASRAMAHPPTHDAPEPLRQPALSSFLQEKLQRERRAESEKLTASPSLSRADMSASVDMGRFFHNGTEAATGRPRSSAGLELPKKKGMGLKEMELAVSNLHKQNFDLKLELFHRHRLVDELEKRDKAVEEAVAMIVTLEAEVDRLVRQRAVAQGPDGPCNFCIRGHSLPRGDGSPQTPGSGRAKYDDDTAVKSITRMPSFLSDRGDKTENLRNVYLGSRAGSALSLPRVVEASSEAEGTTAHALASPSLSVLSESSFVSVYGNKGQSSELASSPPRYVDEPLVLDGFDSGQEAITHPRRRAASVGRITSIAKPPPRSSTAVPFQSLSSVIDYESPLERLMRLDPAVGRDNADRWSAAAATKKKSPRARPATKEEKREALRRVLTDAPGGVRLHDHGMPPTPDTISTSTLHRFKNSNETLAQDQPLGGALLPAADIRYSESSAGAPLGGSNGGHHAPSAKAAAGADKTRPGHRRQTSGQRPQSARPSGGLLRQAGNDWESDSEYSDRRSLESSLDIWLRESAKPDRTGEHISPDLFSFPTDAAHGAWAVDSLYGGAAGGSSGHAQDLRSLRHQLFPWNSGPSPPNRSSSLRAETGSAADSSVSTACGSRPRRPQSDDHQKRGDQQTPAQPQSPPPPQNGEQKRYPPIAGQHGARAGLNRLLRRSLGSAPAPPPAPSDDDAVAASDAFRNYLPMGVPSWVHRSGHPAAAAAAAAAADRSGATPPPIVLSPRQTPRRPESPSDAAADLHACEAEAPAKGPPCPPPVAASQQQDGGGASSSTGGRRKWLPAFGRPSSSKNKGG
ncbi:hypothetical protein XA68_16533 [Ophiocordyceps unilateralis]|uniref:Centrosomin N-terminal motif 1 domain-containing protein n=1 Tax=Ophiocordyceps unilateralis TaxID=268505 RepID=A0A2A9P6B0_OPHUN|nr:hypothetical protein XA68_16533 [Ophiocordyceps unilateralis]